MKPNAKEDFNPDPEYFSDLVASTGLTQKVLAEKMGCSDRAIRQWCSGGKPIKYVVQFALECLVLEP